MQHEPRLYLLIIRMTSLAPIVASSIREESSVTIESRARDSLADLRVVLLARAHDTVPKLVGSIRACGREDAVGLGME